ncbi:MAG: peroxiredoxin [Deltaproteobacteria bacterium]|nr:peroxiredoxin [Deltaproteobacteria bacterium]
MSDSVSFPLLNEPAPQFTAPTTHGPISLSDFKGKWVVLFSHPADFTPVCSTEFIAFAKATPAFDALNTQLIGLSIDSVYSHIAWVRSLKEHFGVDVTFPIIADLSMDVAHKYGMVQPGAASTAAVRAVFVIDPAQKLRAMVYYPLSNGRVIAEFLRLVEALQTTDATGLATPEGWQPGDACIVPPPGTTQAAEARMSEPYDVTDWYFSKTRVSK